MIEYERAAERLAPLPERRPALAAMLTGVRGKCPRCGKGSLFRAFLKVADRCSTCEEVLSHHRADDAPPYFVMLIVGHIVVPMLLTVEILWTPPLWVHLAIWPALAVILAIGALQPVKGAVVGLQWAFRMHGFGGGEEETYGRYGEPSPADVAAPDGRL